MQLEYVLSWMAGLSSLLSLAFYLIQFRTTLPGWLGVNGFILVLVALNIATDLPNLGFAAGGAWLLLAVIPTSAARRAQTMLRRGQWRKATQWFRIAAAFHPWDGLREQARHIEYAQHLKLGDFGAARAALRALCRSRSWNEYAELEQLRLDLEWGRIVERVEAQPVGTRDLKLAPAYLRALGELGQLDRMWEVHGRLPLAIRASPVVKVTLAGYSGMRQATETVLSRTAPIFSDAEVDYWLGVAAQRAGDYGLAEGRLGRASAAAAGVSRSAAAKLERPLSSAGLETLDPRTQKLAARFEATLLKEKEFLPASHGRPAPIGTWALSTTLVVVFLFSLAGGSTNPENLIRMGALVHPSELVDGALWTRVVRAGFLHLGWVHLVLNVLGLMIVGRQIEWLYGWRNLTLLFLGSSVGAYAFNAAWNTLLNSDPQIALGASAGLMGLVGALLSHAAILYRLGNRLLGRQLLFLLAIVAAQVVFDLMTPIVSGQLHLIGALIGAMIGAPLAWKRGRHAART